MEKIKVKAKESEEKEFSDEFECERAEEAER